MAAASLHLNTTPNKKLLAERFGKAAATYECEAVVQRRAAKRMIELLRDSGHAPHGRVLEIGCGTGLFSRLFLEAFSPACLHLNDINAGVRPYLADLIGKTVVFEAGDAEELAFAGGWDLIVSCSALQWFSDPEAFLRRCRGLLAEGGRLAFSTFGPGNLAEITALTGIGLAYRGMREWEAALGRDYRIRHASEETIILRFDSPMAALRHLKRTGVTGVSLFAHQAGWPRRFCREYRNLYGNRDGVPLTFRPQYFVADHRGII